MDSSDHGRDDPLASEYLFTYGTLHQDHAPEEIADVVRGFELMGKGFVSGTMYDLGSYPGVVLEGTSSRRIWGTIFRLPNEKVLSRLDQYEEFDQQAPDVSLFIRRLCPVRLSDGRVLQCWIYEYNGVRGQAPIVESGTWRVHNGRE